MPVMSTHVRLGLALLLTACGSSSGDDTAGSSDGSTSATPTTSATSGATTDVTGATTDATTGPADSTGATMETGSTGGDDSGLIDARPYMLLVPDSYDPATPTPLVVMLHGYGVTGVIQATYFRLLDDADEHGYLLAYPDGTPDAGGNRFWDATDACCNFAGAPVDDVAYLSALLDDVEASYNVDPDRIYFMGHSNGGFMSYRLACDIGERIAAVASLAGATWNDPTACPAAAPVNVLQIHGTDDRTIGYDGGTTGAATFPSAPQTVATWADKNGCGGALTDVDTIDLEVTIAGAETQRQEYADCVAGGDVVLWTIDGGSHIPNFDEGFADAVWEWFDAHPRPGA